MNSLEHQPRRQPDQCNWYLTNPDDSIIWLPKCSADYTPSKRWMKVCLEDPVGPICRTHMQFFKEREGFGD